MLYDKRRAGWDAPNVEMPERMKITFLGTGSGAPTQTRNTSAIALQLPESGRLWLFDCGEGTQHQIGRSPLRPGQIERIFFTHLHGDHLFGLPGLLASRSLQSGGVTPVTLHGPAGLAEFVRAALGASRTRLAYPLHVETITAAGIVHEDETARVACAPVPHGVESYAYAVTERDQPGRFDVEKARSLGIPAGPLYGRLKNGEMTGLPDGRSIAGTELVGPPRPGRRVVFSGDTPFSENVTALAQNADVLVHEATYLGSDAELAARARHSTAAGAAQTARRAGVKTLILTHFSPRYESDAPPGMGDLLAEARAIFPNTLLAHDLWSHEVPRREVEPR